MTNKIICPLCEREYLSFEHYLEQNIMLLKKQFLDEKIKQLNDIQRNQVEMLLNTDTIESVCRKSKEAKYMDIIKLIEKQVSK